MFRIAKRLAFFRGVVVVLETRAGIRRTCADAGWGKLRIAFLRRICIPDPFMYSKCYGFLADWAFSAK